jgi:RNA polymerase sigma-70 factor (ECF subfamily)
LQTAVALGVIVVPMRVIPSSDPADGELLERVAQRCTEAFEELYRRHAPAVNAFGRRLFGDPELAAEATHVAFMRLWDRAHLMERQSRLRAWLITVAHNAAVDRRRRRNFSTITLVEAHDRVAESDPADEVVLSEQKHDVRAALRALPPEQRTVVELSYFGGLSQTEMAHHIGVPLGTIKGRIRLAMRRLKTLLSERELA